MSLDRSASVNPEEHLTLKHQNVLLEKRGLREKRRNSSQSQNKRIKLFYCEKCPFEGHQTTLLL